MEQYPRVLAEMARVCKQGGHIVVFDIESPANKVQIEFILIRDSLIFDPQLW